MKGKRSAIVSTAIVIAGAVLAGGIVGRAQSSGGAPDVLAALLTEVRGLRAAMEQMASAGPRVQLALGRLQLQEQRVNTLVRRMEELRRRMSDADRQLAEQREIVPRLEEALRNSTAEERRQTEHELLMLRRVIERGSAELQQLQGEDAIVAQELANEQARWTGLNQQLEALELTLQRR